MASPLIRTLPNGVRIVVTPIEIPHSLCLSVLGHGGSDYETPETNGIFHVVEHGHFKGSLGYPTQRDISRAIDRRGGDLNAFTGNELVGFRIHIHNRHRRIAADVLSQMVIHPLLREVDFLNARQVVIEEVIELFELSVVQIVESYEQLLYPNHPAGFPVGGYPLVVEGFNHDLLLETFKRFCVGGNIVVSAAGRIDDQEQVFEELAELFSEVESGPALRKQPLRIAQKEPACHMGFKKNVKTHIMLGVHAFPEKDPREDALEVLSIIIGGNMSSILFDVLREKEGITYSPHTSASLYSDRGSLDTQIVVRPENMSTAISFILAEYRRLAQEGPTQEEFAVARDCSVEALDLQLEGPVTVALSFAGHVLKGLETDIEEIRRRREAVTREEVQSVAQDIMVGEGLNISIVGNHGDEDWKKLKPVLESW